MNLILCHSFSKQLKKLGSVSVDDIKALFKKYHPDSSDIIDLDYLMGFEVLKCYFLNKKVRSIVFFRKKSGTFIPVAITRKETKKGRNITKDNYKELFGGDIDRILVDLEEEQYEIKQF